MYFCRKMTVDGVKWLLDCWLGMGQNSFQTMSFIFGSCMVTFDTEHLLIICHGNPEALKLAKKTGLCSPKAAQNTEKVT